MIDDKSVNIFVNTGKTLIFPQIADWYLFTSTFHEMFNEIDPNTGILMIIALKAMIMMTILLLLLVVMMMMMMMSMMMKMMMMILPSL